MSSASPFSGRFALWLACFSQREINQMLLAVNSDYAYTHCVTELKALPTPLSGQPVAAFVVFIHIISERLDMHQTFNEELIQLNIHSVIFNAGYHAIEIFPNVLRHKIGFAPVHQLAFSIIGGAFTLARLVGNQFKI